MDSKYFKSDRKVSFLGWSAMKGGDKSAFESLYNLYSGKLYNYGSKFTKDKELTKDCIQELFVSIWDRKSGLGDPQDIKNYLFKSFRNLIFKKLSALKKHISYEEIDEYVFDVSVSVEEAMMSAENNISMKNRLQASIEKLTSRQKEAVFLRFYENLSYEEASMVMGISVKAGYKIMNRAIVCLRDNLSKSDLILLFIFVLK